MTPVFRLCWIIAMMATMGCEEPPTSVDYQGLGTCFTCPVGWNLNKFEKSEWNVSPAGTDSSKRVGCYGDFVPGEFELFRHVNYPGTLQEFAHGEIMKCEGGIRHYQPQSGPETTRGHAPQIDGHTTLKSDITFVNDRGIHEHYELYFVDLGTDKLLFKYVHNDITDSVARNGIELIHNSLRLNCEVENEG